jgi:hypothetical protein
MHYPSKVNVAAILLLLGGIVGITFGLILVAIGGLSWLTGILPFRDALSAWGGGAATRGLIDFAIGIVGVVAAVGLLLRQSWAWLLGIIAAVVSALGPLISVFSGHFLSVFALIVPVVILLILASPDVRRAFGQFTAEPSGQ